MSAADYGITPGPWPLKTVSTSAGTCHTIGLFPSLGVRKETYACVYADNVREHDYGSCKVGDELLANARAMAKVPEMIAALEAANDCLEDLRRGHGCDVSADCFPALNLTRALLDSLKVPE